MKIAVASCGLGHVSRGIETWARDTAVALAGRGVDVTLFAGGPVGLGDDTVRVPVVVLRGLRRFEVRTQRLAHLSPGVAWRWGLKDGYGWEQFAFWLRLRNHLRRGSFDILHVQDPMLAAWCRCWRTRGWLRTREILAHGTEEPATFLAAFPRVQHLAPWHLQETLAALHRAGDTRPRPQWTAMPNFVDTAMFMPAGSAAVQLAARVALGIQSGTPTIGCVAAVKRDHKRIDHLIGEFARFAKTAAGRNAQLVIAGARQPDSDGLVAQAQNAAPGQVQIRFDVARADMPTLYRAFDVFVLPSVFEMMPIALLEALASGVPAYVHHHPVLTWILGAPGSGEGWAPGGRVLDMAAAGTLAEALADVTPDRLRETAITARQHAEAEFSQQAVIGQYLQYYRGVVAALK
ncbi:MAG: glycosyltransferase family 4 protein [Verrucomicrobia bacterium]|nr:glycosyltransferase family 4 protein [Verrucomicrobiota bacterium]